MHVCVASREMGGGGGGWVVLVRVLNDLYIYIYILYHHDAYTYIIKYINKYLYTHIYQS